MKEIDVKDDAGEVMFKVSYTRQASGFVVITDSITDDELCVYSDEIDGLIAALQQVKGELK